jgi:uncharacterized protein (DUF362 family)/Pyruvate/2-oxoacid:ferredoxin oxidoreductase delta subunit
MTAKVSLVNCESYEPEKVYGAVKECLEPLGGIQAFVKPGNKVLLQVNALAALAPDRAVCTHPAVVSAVCRLVREAGGVASIGGSSAGQSYGITDRVFEVSGIAKSGAVNGASILDYDKIGGEEIKIDGSVLESAMIAKPVLEADIIISLPKMKTHGLTLMTGAVKNHLGIIPGARKAEMHRRFPDPEQFGEALLDIYLGRVPRLAIMDAVQGMDGNGPSAGKVRDIGIVAASPDGVALDTVMCAICSLKAEWVPTLVAAGKRGVGVASLNEIEIAGETVEELKKRVHSFAYPLAYRIFSLGLSSENARHTFWKYFSQTVRPTVITSHCTGCQTCVRSCPMQAITTVKNKANINKSKCISCFCCHEVCLQQAIKINIPLTWRTATRLK